MKKNTIMNVIISTILLGLLFFVTLNISPILRLLNAYPKPEALTELYFSDPEHLPVSIKMDTSKEFSFTIHNIEGKDENYEYFVYVDSGNSKKNLGSNFVFVKNNDTQTITVNFQKYIVKNKDKLVVMLDNKQSIDFIMTD